nr:PH domain-containing protein [Brevundimonas basaltis]
MQGSPSLVLGLPVFVAWSRGEGFPLGLLLAGTGLLLTVTLFVSWLRWRAFTYRILPGQLVIAHGLIKRTRRSIPAERIQDVSIKQGLLARLFGLAEVRIETGGGEADEGQLDSVSLSEAHRLRQVLRSIRTHGGVARAEGGEEEAAETLLFRMELPRLVYSGVFRFSMVWIAAIFGLLQYADQALGYGWDRWLEMLGLAEQALQSRLDITVVMGLSGFALAFGLLAGIVRTVLRNFGFELTHAEARFRYRRGLFTRTEVVVAKRQIQLGLVERGAVSGRMGWRAFKVQTLGGGDHVSGRQELAPFARPDELAPIIALAGLPPSEPSRLRSVSPWHIVSGVIGFVATPAVTLLAATAFFPLAGLLLATLPVFLAVALLRRRCHRYGLASTSVQVRRGVLTRRDWTIPYGNVQAVSVTRGPVQRLLGVCTVRIDTAGGRGLNRPHVHDIDEADAAAFVGDLIQRVESFRRGTSLSAT